MDTTLYISTSGSNVTHRVCGTCGTLLECSAAVPWKDQPEYGWRHCFDAPVEGFIGPDDGDRWHRCGKEAPDA